MAGLSSCDICTSLNTGECVNNQTCVCHNGYIGISCQDRITTSSTPQMNIGVIIASVLGGALFTLIIGLVVFFIWKRRTKKKSFTFSASNSTTATIPPSAPIVVPALYNLSLSQRDSNETSADTLTYHLYDELP